jgi:Probable zinc-ribbon domain
MSYEDKQIVCAESGCGEFTFTKGEQEFYAQKGFTPPKRCQHHREEARRRRESGTTERPKRESDADMLA